MVHIHVCSYFILLCIQIIYREGKIDVVAKQMLPTSKGEPLSTVKVRINPGDYNVKLTNILTTTDTVLTLKNHIRELTTPCEDPTVQEDDTTNMKRGAANTSNNGRELPPCPVERQRVMFCGKELKNHEILGNVGIDTVRVVQIFMRAELKK